MNEIELEEKIKQRIAKDLDIDIERLKPHAFFVQDLGMDSLDLIQLVSALEEELGEEISDDDRRRMRTIGQAVEYVKKRWRQSNDKGGQNVLSPI